MLLLQLLLRLLLMLHVAKVMAVQHLCQVAMLAVNHQRFTACPPAWLCNQPKGTDWLNDWLNGCTERKMLRKDDIKNNCIRRRECPSLPYLNMYRVFKELSSTFNLNVFPFIYPFLFSMSSQIMLCLIFLAENYTDFLSVQLPDFQSVCQHSEPSFCDRRWSFWMEETPVLMLTTKRKIELKPKPKQKTATENNNNRKYNKKRSRNNAKIHF